MIPDSGGERAVPMVAKFPKFPTRARTRARVEPRPDARLAGEILAMLDA